MRIRHFIQGTLVLLTVLTHSCAENDATLPSLDETKTYRSNALKIVYCGEEMPGKQVEMIPGGENSDLSVTLKCQGSTDLGQLSSIGLSGYGAAPGVLPGSPVLELPVRLKQEKSGYTFSGKSSTADCSTFSYKGTLTADSLVMSIFDVELTDKSMAGSVWKPVAFKQSGLIVESTPFYLVWEVNPALGLDVNLSELLKLIVTAPIIPTYHDTAYSSVSQLLYSSLQTVAFKENGNIILRYFSSVGGATQLMTSQGNTLQYVVAGDNMLKLYPNPTSLFGLWLVAQSNSAGIPDISFKSEADNNDSNEALKEALLPIIKDLVPFILQLTQQGIPLQCSRTSEGMALFLNTQAVLTIMNQVATIVAAHPETLDKLSQLLTGNDELGEIASKLLEVLPQLQPILENTTRFEIGLQFLPYNS